MNNNYTEPTTIGLHEVFEKQAKSHAANIAVISDGEEVTYEQLDHLANQLSGRLKHRGIGKGKVVGVWLERSVSVYVAILAILKTGAAYVPLDPHYPAERIRFILSDCKPSLLLTSTSLANENPHFDCEYFYIDQEQQSQEILPLLPIETELTPNDLCYIIYTSGSTGKPKGVEITHRSVCNYVNAASQVYGIHSQDRVYQGFSVTFDASIEEIWLTFATGATLIPGNSAALHAGAGLVEFLTDNRITVLSCVPTLLALLETDNIPSLRLLILGGETCTQDLIARWSRNNLRILNTYGPTEATVVTTYAECHPDKPVTIGQPLPNYQVFILDSDLKPVAKGVTGELCIAGVCLARGYLNRPDLVKTKFINHPELDNIRLYRTGDLARITENDEIQFGGRIDAQIKLRGFRIELREIESVLIEYPGIRHAVVAPQEMASGATSLVAYLILKEGSHYDEEDLHHFLQSRLPEYMVPNLFETIERLPLLASGKIDRAQLPKPTVHQDHISQNYVAPRSALEKKIAAVWEELFQHKPISTNADFFHDLGGHSLLAAKIVSLLRREPELKHISMLDIYENPTIKKFTKKVSSNSLKMKEMIDTIEANIDSNNEPKSKRNYFFCGIAQFFGCYFQFALASWEFLLIYLALTVVMTQYEFVSLPVLGGIIGLFFAFPPLLFVVAIISKWLLLGRIKPGNYRLWGWYYFRWWLTQRIQKSIAPVNFLTGSPLMNLYCRLMGAKIGKNCFIGTMNISSFDLLTIGDDSSIGYNTMLLGYTVEDGWLKIGSNSIGNRCYVGTRAVLSINTTMEDDACLENLSMLPPNSFIPKNKTYFGSPARPLNDKLLNPMQQKVFAKSTPLKDFGCGLLHYFGLVFVAIIYYAAFLPGILFVDYFYTEGNLIKAVVIAAPAGAIAFILIFSASVILIKKLILGRIVAGNYKIKSGYYIRCWIVERLLATRVLEVMADSLYFPLFLRMLGAKIGKRVEMGECPFVSPDLLTMEDESFTASSVSIGLPRIFGGYAAYAPIVVGKRGFVGNIALLPPGSVIGENSLIGCLTTPPLNGDAAKPNTSWLGSPAMFLPKREIFEGFSEKDTFQPTASLYVKRILIETIRIVLPSIFSFICLVGIFLSVDYLYTNYSVAATIALFPIFDILIMLGMTGVAIALKWILVGRLKEEVKPVWSVFIWKYDVFVHLYNEFIGHPILEPLLGTPFVAMFLRLLGTKIGKRAFINSKEFAEYDLITIGDDVALNEECVIQTHLFEDRIFKMSTITIKNNCNIGCDSVVLYSTVMETHSSLGNLSLLMKGEHLPAYSVWEGIPAQTTIAQYEEKSNRAVHTWA